MQQPKIVMTSNLGLLRLLPMVDDSAPRFTDFGTRLAVAMARAHVSIPEVAKAVGVTPEMARRYTLGTAMPRPEKMKRIAALVGLTPSELQYGTVSSANAAPGIFGPQVAKLNAEETQLIDQYRQLPDYAQRALRARATELVEAFGKASTSNPFGQGGTQ